MMAARRWGVKKRRKSHERDWPPIRKDAAGNVYGLELPWANIFSLSPNVSAGHVMRSVPRPPSGPYTIRLRVDLVLTAALMLCDYLRVKDIQELLRRTKHGFRLIITFGLAISGFLRHAHGLPELAVERKARGRVVADIATDPRTVSRLFTGERDVRKPWTAEDTAKYLTIPHSEYVWLELRRLNKDGAWSTVVSPRRQDRDTGPATLEGNEYTMGELE